MLLVGMVMAIRNFGIHGAPDRASHGNSTLCQRFVHKVHLTINRSDASACLDVAAIVGGFVACRIAGRCEVFTKVCYTIYMHSLSIFAISHFPIYRFPTARHAAAGKSYGAFNNLTVEFEN